MFPPSVFKPFKVEIVPVAIVAVTTPLVLPLRVTLFLGKRITKSDPASTDGTPPKSLTNKRLFGDPFTSVIFSFEVESNKAWVIS